MAPHCREPETRTRTRTRTRAWRFALLLVAAACGGLESPDLASGLVAGKITGAQLVAPQNGCATTDQNVPCWVPPYAYPLGRPDLKVSLGADGSYELTAPVGTPAIVLYDGAARAELVPVEVLSAARTEVAERFGGGATVSDALKMPLASVVYASASVDCGAQVRDPRFTMLQTGLATEHAGVAPASASIAALWPVPQGTFDLAAAMRGFNTGDRPVDVPAGTTVLADLVLDVADGDPALGCVSTGCRETSLHCSDQTGYCYRCDSDADCPVTCDHTTWTCVASGSADACDACDPSQDNAQCGASPSACVPLQTDPSKGYCSRTCTATADCPAGFACDGTFCRPPNDDCIHWIASFGASCLEDVACDALAAGQCVGAAGTTSGHCTAPCSAPADCPASLGFTVCDAGLCGK